MTCPHDIYARRATLDEGSAGLDKAFHWNEQNLEVRFCREHEVWVEVPRDLRHPSLPKTTARRERETSVILVKVRSRTCGVCGGPLFQSAIWPDPRATTRGHEPPLSRTSPGDRVVVRPEHWGCNMRKGALLDEEMS